MIEISQSFFVLFLSYFRLYQSSIMKNTYLHFSIVHSAHALVIKEIFIGHFYWIIKIFLSFSTFPFGQYCFLGCEHKMNSMGKIGLEFKKNLILKQIRLQEIFFKIPTNFFHFQCKF